MYEQPKTPERLPVAEVNEGSSTSRTLKPHNRPVAGHNAEGLAQRRLPKAMRYTPVEDMWELLGQTQERMDEAFPQLARIETLAKGPVKSSYQLYTDYLNLISGAVHEKLDYESTQRVPEGVIRFFDRHSNPAKGNATGIPKHPDFLALKEAAGGLLAGQNTEKALSKTVSYTSCLLQSRPDKLAVQGICVDSAGFSLIVSNACGAFYTDHLEWNSRSSQLLLCAWMWRLYRPLVDPSMTANIEADKPPTFTIRLPDGTAHVCTISTASTAFGRRTIVFDCPGRPDIVIKEQYIEDSRKFEEGLILTKIHKKGIFPGVVRQNWHGIVKAGEENLAVQWEDPGDKQLSKRNKTRIVLEDKGGSIMDAETPREVLVAMYDLLEVTRFLYKKRKILHRDISVNNVLLRITGPANTSSVDIVPLTGAAPVDTSSIDTASLQEAVPVNTSSGSPPKGATFAEDLEEMCFASHLLKTKSNSPKFVFSSEVLASAHFYRVDRLDTKVLLIDFDMGEDEEASNEEHDKKGPHPRTGTPIFMARDVISAMQMAGDYILQPVPELVKGIEIYEAAVPERLTAFPPNKKEICTIPKDKPLDPFKHKLRYDAESVFWLLLWWAIHALPANDKFPDYKHIRDSVWSALTGGHGADLRGYFLGNPKQSLLHPAYQGLETLLKQMGPQLRGYHEESDDLPRREDEYLHEVFQRLIFEFLLTHYDDAFMTEKKSANLRKPEKVGQMEAPLSTNQMKTLRSSAASRPVDSPSLRDVQTSSSRNIRASSSRNDRSDPSLKRKRSSESDPQDKDYGGKPLKRK